MSESESRKRRMEDESALIPAAKKPKLEDKPASQALIQVDQPRTSKLQAPIMLLTGHESDVYTVRFSPDGDHLASGGRDKDIFLWKVYDNCTNYMLLKGHKNAILEVAWSIDSKFVYSASADKTVGVWDLTTGRRKLKLTEHSSYVNSVAGQRSGTDNIISASDDTTVKLWDTKTRRSVLTLPHSYPVTAVALNDGNDLRQVFTGGLDNDIRCYDLRAPEVPVFIMKGHTDTVTSLKVDPYGSYLLTNAMDNTVRIWDVRPYSTTNRCVKIFTGATHNAEKNLIKASWAKDGSRIACGSADKMVYVWDTTTRVIKYCLPGHTGPVNEVDFHPKENIIASGSNDRKIYLGELSDQ